MNAQPNTPGEQVGLLRFGHRASAFVPRVHELVCPADRPGSRILRTEGGGNSALRIRIEQKRDGSLLWQTARRKT
jgi:hypothetical protein